MTAQKYSLAVIAVFGDKPCLFAAAALLTLLLVMPAIVVSAATSRDAADSSVLEAEQSVIAAYEAIVRAEEAGANVSNLLTGLNVATELLSLAQMALEDGDFDQAVRLADMSNGVGSEVKLEAEGERLEASQVEAAKFWLLLGVSGVGVAAVSITSFLAYYCFKRRYFQRPLKTRPRVEE